MEQDYDKADMIKDAIARMETPFNAEEVAKMFTMLDETKGALESGKVSQAVIFILTTDGKLEECGIATGFTRFVIGSKLLGENKL